MEKWCHGALCTPLYKNQNKMMSTLICFATEKEAEASLASLQATKIESHLYHCPYGHILITGMGLTTTYERLSSHMHAITKISNFGIVGALKTNIHVGSIHAVQLVGRDEQSIQLQRDGLKLISSPVPLHDPQLRDTLAKNYDIIDMEGFSIAQFAQEKNVPLTMHKIVSDYCTADTSKHIMARLPELSKQLAAHITKWVVNST